MVCKKNPVNTSKLLEKQKQDEKRKEERNINNICKFCGRFMTRKYNLSLIGGVKNDIKTYDYHATKILSLELSNKNTKECMGSGFDGVQSSKLKFNIVKGDNFKESVFQYHIEPSDPDTNHMTNLLVLEMVLSLKWFSH